MCPTYILFLILLYYCESVNTCPLAIVQQHLLTRSKRSANKPVGIFSMQRNHCASLFHSRCASLRRLGSWSYSLILVNPFGRYAVEEPVWSPRLKQTLAYTASGRYRLQKGRIYHSNEILKHDAICLGMHFPYVTVIADTAK